MKGASSNVETVFSGAGNMSAKKSIGGDVLADYSICHQNWQYDFLRPRHAEIWAAWEKIHGKEQPKWETEEGQAEDDNAESSSESEGDGDTDEDGAGVEGGQGEE